jgi:hypothetical protein
MSTPALALVELIPPPEDHDHRFPPITFAGKTWDMSHLDSFAFRCEIQPGLKVDVVILFSCHVFTHSLNRDARDPKAIPAAEIYDDGRERRVLDASRYELSCLLLRNMVQELPKRTITVASSDRNNYVTWEVHSNGTKSVYAVYFEIKKDSTRKRRLVLRIQSAYLLEEGLPKRQQKAGKVSWSKLIKATYEGRKIRP